VILCAYFAIPSMFCDLLAIIIDTPSITPALAIWSYCGIMRPWNITKAVILLLDFVWVPLDINLPDKKPYASSLFLNIFT